MESPIAENREDWRDDVVSTVVCKELPLVSNLISLGTHATFSAVVPFGRACPEQTELSLLAVPRSLHLMTIELKESFLQELEGIWTPWSVIEVKIL